MKIYAIEVIETNGKLLYSIYTCKFLSERHWIDEDLYEFYRKTFKIPHKNNNYRCAMYFEINGIFDCD